MDRYANMELECDGGGGGGGGGGVAQKAALFGGMFKKSSKSAEPSVQAQVSISAGDELSKSSDSLTDNNNTKDKGGVFKGMFKKTTKEGPQQETLSVQSQDLSASSDSLTDNNKSSKDKLGVLSGILRRSPKPGRRPSQDFLENELLASNDSLSENTNTKETGGKISGLFKRTPKPLGARTQSQDDLSAPSEQPSSNDNLSVNHNAKETGGMFGGMFKKSPKPFGARTQSQDDLSAPSELSGSNDNLSENNTKEKGGIFSGVFKKPKLLGAKSQDDLSADNELSASSDSLAEKPSKGGVAAKILKNPFTSSSQDKEKPEHSGESNESKAKQNGFSAMMKSTFYADKQEKSSGTDVEETLDNGDSQPSLKQNKLAGAVTKLNLFRTNKNEKQTVSDDKGPPASSEKSSVNKQSAMVGVASKLNPFRSANKKDTEDTETLKETEEKPKLVKSNMIHQERKERSETPLVPPRPTEEEMKGTSTYDKVKTKDTEDIQFNKDMISTQKKEKPAETPVRAEEELKRAARSGLQKQLNNHQNQSDDEGLKEDTMNPAESKTTKVKKSKQHNPFMPRSAAKALSDDEGLKEDKSSSKEEKKEEEGNDKPEETKVKRPKRHNPFMPRVKERLEFEQMIEAEDTNSLGVHPLQPKVIQKNVQDGAAGNTENEGGNRSLFDQLEDLRVDPSQPKDEESLDLMEWWNTVEAWEDTPQKEDMTEKEEAKAFAVTADKVQKGIRVFNKLFTERAESLWQHVIDLNGIADSLDKFNKNTKIAQITGGSTSAIGGVATIAGLALAPVTMGTSLIVTAVGLGVATAGGLTSAGAGISNQVNNSMDRKKVEKIVQDYQEKMADLNKCLTFIKQGIENLHKFDLIKMKNHGYNRDFPVLSSSFYEDGAMVGKAILINANEIMRVVQIANVAGSTAARAVQIASMATGVLTGLFVGMDIYFVAKDSKELKKGAKSEFAAKIRDVATQLHDGLVELNGLRDELQSSSTRENDAENDTAALDRDKKKEDENNDSSEDEIDRIKKAIKKDIENREYV